MPELPEVERATRLLRRALIGRSLVALRALHPSQRRALSAAHAKRAVGSAVIDVSRRAKLQLVTLANGRVVEVHFRMNGDWDFGRADDDAPRFERVRMELDDGSRVSLVDSRALSVVRVHEPGALSLDAYGPEPLGDDFTSDSFAAALGRRATPIKPLLLDQRLVAGLGNIYAAESLWEAKIDPRAAANTLSIARVKRLHAAIRTVLERAPAARYYEAAGHDEAADDDSAWRVYDREGLPCVRCKTKIRRIVQAGRSTFYCSKCQR